MDAPRSWMSLPKPRASKSPRQVQVFPPKTADDELPPDLFEVTVPNTEMAGLILSVHSAAGSARGHAAHRERTGNVIDIVAAKVRDLDLAAVRTRGDGDRIVAGVVVTRQRVSVDVEFVVLADAAVARFRCARGDHIASTFASFLASTTLDLLATSGVAALHEQSVTR